jgi:hypothetical protein
MSRMKPEGLAALIVSRRYDASRQKAHSKPKADLFGLAFAAYQPGLPWLLSHLRIKLLELSRIIDYFVKKSMS